MIDRKQCSDCGGAFPPEYFKVRTRYRVDGSPHVSRSDTCNRCRLDKEREASKESTRKYRIQAALRKAPKEANSDLSDVHKQFLYPTGG